MFRHCTQAAAKIFDLFRSWWSQHLNLYVMPVNYILLYNYIDYNICIYCNTCFLKCYRYCCILILFIAVFSIMVYMVYRCLYLFFASFILVVLYHAITYLIISYL